MNHLLLKNSKLWLIKKYDSSVFLTIEPPIQINDDAAKKTCDKHMNRAKVRQEKDSKARCNRC
jgi:hypothetical protein